MTLQSVILLCHIQLCFHRVATFNQWWQDGKTPNFDHEGLLRANVSIRDRRTGPLLNLEIEVCKNGSLETAGRRIALFTRLIDEYNITSLLNENNQP